MGYSLREEMSKCIKKGAIMYKILLSLGIVFLVSSAAFSFNYVLIDPATDDYTPAPTDPQPARGVPYVDSYFNTTITRVTDCDVDPDDDSNIQYSR